MTPTMGADLPTLSVSEAKRMPDRLSSYESIDCPTDRACDRQPHITLCKESRLALPAERCGHARRDAAILAEWYDSARHRELVGRAVRGVPMSIDQRGSRRLAVRSITLRSITNRIRTGSAIRKFMLTFPGKD